MDYFREAENADFRDGPSLSVTEIVTESPKRCVHKRGRGLKCLSLCFYLTAIPRIVDAKLEFFTDIPVQSILGIKLT